VEEILHQLVDGLSHYIPIIYRVSTIQGGADWISPPEVRSEGRGLEAHLAALEPEIPGMTGAIRGHKPKKHTMTGDLEDGDDLGMVYCWLYHIKPVRLWYSISTGNMGCKRLTGNAHPSKFEMTLQISQIQ
jgi:hypothetical protein